MKRSYFFKAGFLMTLLLTMMSSAYAADPDTLYMRYIEGTVNLSEAGSGQWMEAAVNTPLIEGDTVGTGPTGQAELFLKDGSMVRAGKNSIMKIIAVNDKGVQFKLEQGTTYVVSRGSKEVPIFLDTPSAILDIASPSTVRIDAYSNGITEISVLKGGIFAAAPSGRMLVRQGERLVLKTDGSMPVMAGLRASDEWLRWNIDRDRAITADTGVSNSYAYLPDELKTYSSDLDANGQWIYTPEHGYAWVPTVITVGTWSPYRFGQWAWIRGSYVWIGYEPWGWAPYHYGRWIHDRHAGWCWVPPKHRDVRWEPAHVAWVHSSRHVGWVPLAPGERYNRLSAPVIHQTNKYTMYNNLTIERSATAAATRYKNASVANSMVTVERDRILRQTTTHVNTATTGPVMLKKVGLPANVTPVRASGIASRQVTDKNVPPPARAVNVSSGVPGTTSKTTTTTGNAANISPASTPVPSVQTRQLQGTPLNSRIENARSSAGRDGRISTGSRGASQPVKTVNASPAQKEPAVAPVHTSALPLVEKTGAKGSAVNTYPRPPSPQPVALKQEVRTQSMTGASPVPANIAGPVKANQAPTKTTPPPNLQNLPQTVVKPPVRTVNVPNPARQNTEPSARVTSSRPPVQAPVQVRQINTVNTAPANIQPVRPAPQGRQSASVVSAPSQPARAPEASRQPQVRSEPVRSPAPTPKPVPQAASPAKPAPVPPAKNENTLASDKNNTKPPAQHDEPTRQAKK